jgi:hypothetical protein
MRSGQVYPALVHVLEDWRMRPAAVLSALVGGPPEVGEVEVEGELVRIETSATWADAKHAAVLVEAVAYGPASWLTERVAERTRIELRPEKRGGDV